MKQKQLKYIISGILAFSIFSAVYVNLDSAQASRLTNQLEPLKTAEPVLVEEEEDKQEGKLPIPDATVIGRLVDLAHQIVSFSN